MGKKTERVMYYLLILKSYLSKGVDLGEKKNEEKRVHQQYRLTVGRVRE